MSGEPRPPQSPALVRVVVVDDEADVRDLLRLRLERNGHFEVVGIGGDGPDAVALCAEHEPDLLVLDALMPSGNGTEFVPEIFSVAPSTVVIIYTGDTGLATRNAAERVGAHAVIGKLDPFDRLLGTIFRLIPEKAPVPEKDDFEDRMTSLLEDEGGGKGRRRRSQWRSGEKSRVLLIAVLVLVVLPSLAAVAWVIAMLAGLAL